MYSGKIGRNETCPCGSGRKYKHCCGRATLDMTNQPLLQSIHIENFRCLHQLQINPLARVNLIAGKNSVGKTALLEAIFLLIGAENLELILKISHFRGIRELKGELVPILELLWAPLFYNLDVSKKISIVAQTERNKRQKVELAVTPAASQTFDISYNSAQGSLLRPGFTSSHVLTQTYDNAQGLKKKFTMSFTKGELRIEPAPTDPPFPGFFLYAQNSPTQDEAATLFGKLVRAKQVDQLDLVEVLKLVEPRLRQLDVVPSAGSSMIYGDIGLEQMLPLSLMGDGMSRVMSVLLRIANAAGGIVLIDEIENGLHYSILENFWRAVDSAAKTFNTQVIATTHSYECIREAHQAFQSSNEGDFLFHRLDRIHERIESVTYDQEALGAALKADFEVR